MYSCGRNIVLAKLGLQYVCSNLGWKEFCRTYDFLQIATKPRADEQTRTADLISLRVIIHALQGIAGACKSRISKPLSLLRFAAYCTVLRYRWYQSGVSSAPIVMGPSMSC